MSSLKDAEINKAKEVLAYEQTKIVHGQEEAEKALAAAHAAFSAQISGFGKGGKEGMPSIEISLAELEKGIPVLDLFAMTELCSTKSDARRLVQQGGAWIFDTKIEKIDEIITSAFVQEDEMILRAGKKRYFRLIIVE